MNLLTSATPDEVPALIRDLYAIVGKLESIFPGRHFTPDGHLVGGIGEALAGTYYGIELCRASTEGYDGVREGRKVEVKATQGERIALSSCPEHLLVFKLNENGSFDECFNGPGGPGLGPRREAKVDQKRPTSGVACRVEASDGNSGDHGSHA